MVKRICILGSGLVSGSVVNFFCRDTENEHLYSISVGSIVSSELESLQKKYKNIKTTLLDVTRDADKLWQLIQSSDIVISLLTNEMQVPIAKTCIALKKNMVHASYCTKEMMELDFEAKESEVTILNEMGLDPGIDHLLAMKAIDEIRREDGSKITSFISYCGGLPEPEVSKSNPLRYKFSWSPLTSLRNLLNSARYLINNKIVEIPAGGYLIDAIEPSSDDFHSDIIQLETYPNRDSLIYKDLYQLSEATTVLRGTYRYRGFHKIINALFRLGLFSQQTTKSFKENGSIDSWGDLVMNMLRNETNLNSIDEVLFHHGFEQAEIDMLALLGILSKKTPLKLHDTLLETLADYLTEKLKYEPGERDMVIMRHEVSYEKPDNQKGHCEKLRREITFVAYGEQDRDGFSAMSKTVALTIGHAVILLLNGKIQKKGVILPFTADIYDPILENLEKEGLIFIEKITKSV